MSTNYAETTGQLNAAQQKSLEALETASGPERMLAELRRFLVRRRTFLGLLAVFVLLFIAEPTPSLMALGAGLMAVAHVLRAVCAGYLDKDERLVTSGPFRYCRNPLYASNLLVVIAFTLMSGRLEALPILVGMWLITHAPTVAYEEEFLRERFGERFDDYCRQVPRWIPRLPGSCGDDQFCWKRLAANGEHLHIISAWIVAAMFFIELVR